MSRNLDYQRGAALFTALMFLVILTLISITAMRTSTMELQMANNEQWRRFGVDSAQSATDVVVTSDEVKIGTTGDISCFGFGSTPTATQSGGTCTNATDMGSGAGYGEDNDVEITMVGMGTCPPSIATSARGSNSLRADGNGSGSCAYYSVESFYDATAKRGGRTETQEGFVRLTAN